MKLITYKPEKALPEHVILHYRYFEFGYKNLIIMYYGMTNREYCFTNYFLNHGNNLFKGYKQFPLHIA